jgi:hypothetical protein
MTKEEVFEMVQGNIPILVRNPKTGKITNPFSTRYGYDAVINGLTEAIVEKLNMAGVVKSFYCQTGRCDKSKNKQCDECGLVELNNMQ